MALVQSVLSAQLSALYKNTKSSEYTEEQFAEEFSLIIHNYILTATVTGSCPSGAVTGSLL